MADTKRQVPNLRFKGFTDNWEQRKLGEISQKVTRKSPDNAKLPVLTNSAEKGIIRQDSFFDKKIAQTTKNYYIVENNNFVYNPRISKTAPYGPIRRNTLGFSGAMSPLYYVFQVNSTSNSFLEQYFKSDNWYKFMYKNGDSGARSDRFAIKDSVFVQMPISIPAIPEQRKIANLLFSLDNIIFLQQRKLVLLKQLKKGLLQKMFADKGSKRPILRFEGFNDDWEGRKLENSADYIRGSFPQPYGNKEWYGGTNAKPFVQVVDVNTNMRLNKKTKEQISVLAQPKSRFVPSDSIVVTLQGSIGRVAITQYDSYVDRTLLIFTKYKVPVDKYFWAYSIQNIFRIEKQKAPGGTIKTITKRALSSFEVSLPVQEEQKKIGTLLKNIDDIITSQQEEVSKLKKIKKSLLQQMFI